MLYYTAIYKIDIIYCNTNLCEKKISQLYKLYRFILHENNVLKWKTHKKDLTYKSAPFR